MPTRCKKCDVYSRYWRNRPVEWCSTAIPKKWWSGPRSFITYLCWRVVIIRCKRAKVEAVSTMSSKYKRGVVSHPLLGYEVLCATLRLGRCRVDDWRRPVSDGGPGFKEEVQLGGGAGGRWRAGEICFVEDDVAWDSPPGHVGWWWREPQMPMESQPLGKLGMDQDGKGCLRAPRGGGVNRWSCET
jgi:hypothetical protein